MAGSGLAADPLHLPNTDWLRHELLVTGPAAAVSSFRAAAAGAGGIPWFGWDMDLEEEDRVHALLRPPDGSPGLSLAAARTLAGALRLAVQQHQERVIEASAHSRACPFDLQALLPVPGPLLRLGPEDPATLAWLREHWGVLQALRHVRLRNEAPDRRRRRSGRLEIEFWSADWTPWAALRAIRTRWPDLILDLRPDYGGD